MFIGCILFAWPNKMPDFFWLRKDGTTKTVKRSGLLTWNVMQKKFPWSVIMLLGGGFALAAGVKESQLSLWIGCHLQSLLKDLPNYGIVTAFTIIITFITEVSSNTATAAIFVPIMLSVAENLKVNPLYFALPTTIAPSFAFMLPVATPPNAIIYETGALRIIDMIVVGFLMNIFCIVITLININTYGMLYFNLSTYPSWALQLAFNSTSTC